MRWKSKCLVGMGLIGVMFGCSVRSEAAPADNEIGSYKQPNGQQFEAQLVGDEFLSYTLVNDTGDLIELSDDGYWYYSLFNEETKQTIPSKSKYLLDERPAEALDSKDIKKLEPRKTEVVNERTLNSVVKWDKEQPLLVVLIEFEDVKLKYSDANWEKRVFSQTEKSLVSYYKEATKDSINIVPAKTKTGEFNGIVKVQLDREHPKVGKNFDLARPVLKEAIEKLGEYVDIKAYDRNKNGIIEQNELHIMGIFAGYESSSITMSNSVWGHKGSFQGRPIGYPTVDGIKLNNYTLFGETMVKKNSNPAKQYDYQSELGLIAHEFGHDLKLPDLYNSERTIIQHDGKYVEVSNGGGLGKYSLMAGGSWTYLEGEEAGATPTHLDAYSKVALGIVEPKVINKEQTAAVNHISRDDFNIYRVNTLNPKEYFLVENRQLTGFDASLKTVIYSKEHGYKSHVASGGIAIYHVNEAFSKNTSPTSQLVSLKEADEGILGYSKLNELSYFSTNNFDGFYYVGQGGHGKAQQNTMYKTTTPSTQVSSGDYADWNIIVNSEPDNVMKVSFVNDPVPVSDVKINPKNKELLVGETYQLNTEIMPENATNKNVTWHTSDENIAVVDKNGQVTAKSKGAAIINAVTEDGQKTAACTIDVTIEKPLSEWFEDENLAKMIGYNLNLILTDKVSEKRLTQVKKLDLRFVKSIAAIRDTTSEVHSSIFYPMGDGNSINNLKGIEVFKELEELLLPSSISEEEIDNLSLISQLPQINTIGVVCVSQALSIIELDLSKITTLRVESLSESDMPYLEKMTNLKSIDYYDSESRDYINSGWIEPAVISTLAKNENLEKIAHFSFIETNALKQLQTIPNLKELDICLSEPIVESVNYLKQLSNLEKLSIKGFNLDSPDSLELFSDMNNLYALSFNTSDENIDFSVLSELENLKELSVSARNIRQWKSLSKLSNLTKLTIDSEGTAIKDISFLKGTINLEKLVINRLNGVDDYSDLGGLTKLTQLSLGVDNSDWKPIDFSSLGNLSGLKELDLRGVILSEEINQDTTFLHHLTNLEALDLEFTMFSDIEAIHLMKKLRYFRYGYSSLNDNDVLAIFENSRGVHLSSGGWSLEQPNIYFF